MATTARNLQARLFGPAETQSPTITPQTERDGRLQINIPKTKGTPGLGSLRPKLGRRSASTGRSSSRFNSFRGKLSSQLGTEYDGAEKFRLAEDAAKEKHWKRWGPYLSERQWATVREDYSADGNAWGHFPHEHARSRTYRWGEDGIAGISDNHQRLCFSLSFWNGQDRILKERLFGLANHEGNHGEDVKELYYYLDSTPTHSYMKYLYKYPQRPFPYEELTRENANRNRDVTEFEIMDTEAFDENKYWDIFIEYAKDADDPNAISVRVSAFNRGPDAADIHLMPQFWFSNYWSWPLPQPEKPTLTAYDNYTISASHPSFGKTFLHCPSAAPPAVGAGDTADGFDIDEDMVHPTLLFAENETNMQRLWNVPNSTLYPKDAFHDEIIPAHRQSHLKRSTQPSGDAAPSESIPHASCAEPNGNTASFTDSISAQEPERYYVNPEKNGTKSAAHYHFKQVPSGGCVVIRVKLTPKSADEDTSINDDDLFDSNIEERRAEADEFYARIHGNAVSDDLRSVMRQALGGMLWSKQYYQFIQKDWIQGDPAQPPPPPERKWVRNKEWKHMHAADILSMPDKWEYPFFAAWDSAFHCIPLAIVDPAFAKKQLELFVREWYMKPDGQIPAYEWNFGDVNPPVHAWATFRVFKIERKLHGREDLQFLESVFQKLLLNFTWWVNRKDQGGNNIFEGGFLGLDNIGAFNRSEPLPTGGTLRQADGTAWMAFYCLNMLNMALELAKHNPVYEDIASKFFEHFLFIADAMTYRQGEDDLSLWNEDDGLYYDAIEFGPGHTMQLPVRSLVGLIPLYATCVLEPSTLNRFPNFKKRMEWFIDNRPEVSGRNMANIRVPGRGERRLLALADKDRLQKILQKMLDENEFFSDHGIRSLSKKHKDQPWGMDVNGERYEVGYWPGDSRSGMFGGNSNWRGPIWLAVNFLLIESLQRFYQYYGDDLRVECPTGSGETMNLLEVAEEIQHRIIHIFARDTEGCRATNGGNPRLNHDPYFRDYVNFYEFFHADDGRGLGASHQTGWTGLVAWHILQTGLSCRLPKTPRTPRSLAQHYFQERLDSRSEYGGFDEDEDEEDDESYISSYNTKELQSAMGDMSPDAL